MSCQKKGNTQALKHGDSKKRLYGIWAGMFHRRYKTYNPKVCVEWVNYIDFKIWSYNNGYNDSLTIDRIDNKKDYSPSNCQWITLKENVSKDKIIFNDDDKLKVFNDRKKLKLTQIEMAKMLNVSRNTIQRAEKFIKNKK